MYRLVRVSMHDWYAFQAKDVDVDGTVGLIGRSGSGKSTFEDAILTVLLGANENHLSLNAAAAGKGGKSGDRSLKGYCLCSFFDVDEGAYQRETAETTLVLTFRHAETGETVACGVMMSADKALHGVEVERLFVAQGLDFSFASHLQMDERGQRVLPTQGDIYAAIKAALGPRLQTFSTKTRYVEGLLTALNPAAPPDANRFMKALSQCRHLKEIGKPSEFVRMFVLEPSRLRVDEVRESIAAWRGLETEVAQIRRKLDRLREVVSRNALIVREQLCFKADSFRIADIDRRFALSRANGLADDLAEAARSHEKAEADLTGAVSEIDLIQEQSVEAAALRAADGSAAAVEGLRRDRQLKANLVEQSFVNIKAGLQAFARVQGAEFEIDEGERRALLAGVMASNAIRKAISGPESLVSAVTDGSLVSALGKVKAASGSASEVEAVRDLRIRERDDLEPKLRDLRGRVAAAKEGRAYVPDQVGRMLDHLREAGIHARVVSDLVKVTDPRWAMAVAMVLGPEETAIIPPFEKVEAALRVQRRHGDGLADCRVLRTERLRAEAGTVRKGSLAEVCETYDADVAAFLAQRLGGVMRVENEAELMQHRIAITPDGLFAGPLSVRKHRNVRPRLGQTHTGTLLSALQGELTEMEERYATATAEAHAAEALLRALRGIQDLDLDALKVGLERYMSLRADLRASEEQLSAASQGIDEISARIDELGRRMADARRRRDQAQADVRKHNGDLQALRERHKQAKAEADGHQLSAARHLRELQTPETLAAARNAEPDASLWVPAEPWHWVDAHLPPMADHDAWTKELQRLREEAARRQGAHRANEKDQLRQARFAWRQFLEAHPEESRADSPDEPAAILDYAVGLRERTSRNVLIPFEEKVAEARRRMETSLKEDLLAKMGDKLRATGNQIRELNRLLTEKSYVGGYRYTFAREPSAEHRDIIALVEAVRQHPALGLEAILDDESLSDGTGNLRRAMDRIEAMLDSGKDIEVLADHRRYFEYRIEALAPGATKPRDFADLVGKLSGGEKEAPYYVAIAATMRSVYYPGQRAQGFPGMALVVLDEAFSKLDVQNTRKLIEHFNGMGLQLVIAAPDNNLATFMQCADSVVMIHRGENASRVTVEVMRPKPRLRDELAARMPTYVPSDRQPSPAVPAYGLLV